MRSSGTLSLTDALPANRRTWPQRSLCVGATWSVVVARSRAGLSVRVMISAGMGYQTLSEKPDHSSSRSGKRHFSGSSRATIFSLQSGAARFTTSGGMRRSDFVEKNTLTMGGGERGGRLFRHDPDAARGQPHQRAHGVDADAFDKPWKMRASKWSLVHSAMRRSDSAGSQPRL